MFEEGLLNPIVTLVTYIYNSALLSNYFQYCASDNMYALSMYKVVKEGNDRYLFPKPEM